MIAILTKYLPPGNVLGSRIKATANRNSITIGYPHGLSGAETHASAALALCKKMGWEGELIGGGTETGYAFVFSNSDRFPIA